MDLIRDVWVVIIKIDVFGAMGMLLASKYTSDIIRPLVTSCLPERGYSVQYIAYCSILNIASYSMYSHVLDKLYEYYSYGGYNRFTYGHILHASEASVRQLCELYGITGDLLKKIAHRDNIKLFAEMLAVYGKVADDFPVCAAMGVGTDVGMDIGMDNFSVEAIRMIYRNPVALADVLTGLPYDVDVLRRTTSHSDRTHIVYKYLLLGTAKGSKLEYEILCSYVRDDGDIPALFWTTYCNKKACIKPAMYKRAISAVLPYDLPKPMRKYILSRDVWELLAAGIFIVTTVAKTAPMWYVKACQRYMSRH